MRKKLSTKNIVNPRLKKSDGGQAMVETAIVFIVFLSLLMGVMQMAVLAKGQMFALLGAQQVARSHFVGKSANWIGSTTANAANSPGLWVGFSGGGESPAKASGVQSLVFPMTPLHLFGIGVRTVNAECYMGVTPPKWDEFRTRSWSGGPETKD